MEKRVIFHIDVNSAFLSWEAVYRLKHLGGKLDLRTIPSAVGGDISKRHGISVWTAGTGGWKDQRPDTGRTGIYSECGSLFQQAAGKDGFGF